MAEVSDRVQACVAAVIRQAQLIDGASSGAVLLRWEDTAVIVAEVRLTSPWALPEPSGPITQPVERREKR